MKRCWRHTLLMLLLLMVSGCTATLQSVFNVEKSPAARSIDHYQEKAATLEKQGDLQPALLAWRVVAAQDPENAKAAESMQRLTRAIADATARHYKKGIDHFQAGEMDKAQREFLITLRLDPGHARALYYLTKRLSGPNQETHTVQRGESYGQIATGHYNDPSKAAIIAYFNDLDPKKPLLIDTLLLLPALSDRQLLPRREIEAQLARAEQALDEKHYTEVLAIAARISETSPGHPQIQALNDAARFGQGMLLLEEKQYHLAQELLKKVSPNFKGRDRAMQQAQQGIQAQASDDKLRLAQEQFDQGAFEGTIIICDAVLSEDPANPKARTLSDAAHYALGKQYLDQGNEARAIETLKVLGRDYNDTAQLLAQAQGRLNARAEEYYRKGVKHFLNEELEEAVAAWKKALSLNPNHPKARQDMDNALRLLEKWRGLEKGDKKGQ
ncbi:MAG: tetratricopeptide repeat protein [Desulfatitalea sp.]